ncbi:MAG: hypothetical protein PHV34_10130, partial [Verrucomicrobiae bacterium]|nr:hypothetical protein [Verrucomicrobiae bacterium]
EAWRAWRMLKSLTIFTRSEFFCCMVLNDLAPIVLYKMWVKIRSKGRAETQGSLYLDELEVQDYNVVTLCARGDAQKSDGRLVEVTSPVFFVQIRPFRKDVHEGKSCSGEGSKKVDQLVHLIEWVIEEQRRVVRSTYGLRDNSLPPDEKISPDRAAKETLESQRLNLKKIFEVYEFASSLGEDTIPAEVLTLFDQAREDMEKAIPPLEHQEWASAVPPEERALGHLVEILRNLRRIIGKGECGEYKKSEPRVQTLRDRQTYRLSELEKLASEQETLNKDAEKTDSDKKELADRQREIVEKTGELANQQEQSEAVRRLLEDARHAMQQAEKAVSRNLSAEAGQWRKKAEELLRQAIAHEAAEKQTQTARFLQQMLRQMGEMQKDLEKPEGNPHRQQETAAKALGEMDNRLQELAGSAGENIKKLLNDAADQTAEAEKTFAEGKGRPETLNPSMDALAKAYAKALGRSAHLAKLEQELRELKQQLEGARKQMENGKAEKNEALREWFKELEARQQSLEAELRMGLNWDPGLSRLCGRLHDHWAYVPGYAGEWKLVHPQLGELVGDLSKIHRALESRLKEVFFSDLLGAMQNEDVPPEYRELVNAYFERLSREIEKETGKKSSIPSTP